MSNRVYITNKKSFWAYVDRFKALLIFHSSEGIRAMPDEVVLYHRPPSAVRSRFRLLKASLLYIIPWPLYTDNNVNCCLHCSLDKRSV